MLSQCRTCLEHGYTLRRVVGESSRCLTCPQWEKGFFVKLLSSNLSTHGAYSPVSMFWVCRLLSPVTSLLLQHLSVCPSERLARQLFSVPLSVRLSFVFISAVNRLFYSNRHSVWRFAAHSPIHHTFTCLRSNSGFGVLPMDTSTFREEEEPRIKLTTLQLADNPLYLLRDSRSVDLILDSVTPRITTGGFLAMCQNSLLLKLDFIPKQILFYILLSHNLCL